MIYILFTFYMGEESVIGVADDIEKSIALAEKYLHLEAGVGARYTVATERKLEKGCIFKARFQDEEIYIIEYPLNRLNYE